MNPAILEKTAPEMPALPVGKFPYGWNATPATKPTLDEDGEPVLDIHDKAIEELLPFPQFYRKTFTHPMRSVVLGSPKRGGFWEGREPNNKRQLKRCNECKPVRYMVWHDHSLRGIDNVLRKQFARMSPEQQAALISKAVQA